MEGPCRKWVPSRWDILRLRSQGATRGSPCQDNSLYVSVPSCAHTNRNTLTETHEPIRNMQHSVMDMVHMAMDDMGRTVYKGLTTASISPSQGQCIVNIYTMSDVLSIHEKSAICSNVAEYCRYIPIKITTEVFPGDYVPSNCNVASHASSDVVRVEENKKRNPAQIPLLKSKASKSTLISVPGNAHHLPHHMPLAEIPFSTSLPVSESIKKNVQSTADFLKDVADSLLDSHIRLTIDSFPWKHKGDIIRRAKFLKAATRTNLVSRNYDPVLNGVVDKLLPSLDDLLIPSLDSSEIFWDVKLYLGHPANTRLEFYEAVYMMVTEHVLHSAETYLLFDALFDSKEKMKGSVRGSI